MRRVVISALIVAVALGAVFFIQNSADTGDARIDDQVGAFGLGHFHISIGGMTRRKHLLLSALGQGLNVGEVSELRLKPSGR